MSYRIWVTAYFADSLGAMAYELTGLPTVPHPGDGIDLPTFLHQTKGAQYDLFTVGNRYFWVKDRYVTIKLNETFDREQEFDLLSVGWIRRTDEALRAKEQTQ